MHTIHYATGNNAKFNLGQAFLAIHNPNLSLIQFAEDLPERQTFDQEAIAKEKALAAWQRLRQPVLADDVGVYFDAYNKFPGFMTKYVYHALGLDGILKLLKDNPRTTIKIFLAYADDQGKVHLFEGNSAGVIIDRNIPTGVGNPFDYCFIPDGFDVPLIEIPAEIRKNTFFFRQDALKKFADWHLQPHHTL